MIGIDPRIGALHEEVTRWRRDFHAHPETLYDVERTAGVVATRLAEFGVDEVVPGVGRTGVVGVIHGRRAPGARVIGLRADMDALPIDEETNLLYASRTPGKMHACGHDGHTAMLLGAAKHLAANRDFDGSIVLIFQPAEEGGAGGKAMVDDGLMTRWNVDEVYGMHNMPGLPAGSFSLRPGPMMAAADLFRIEIIGRGSHAAKPHEGVDPVLIGAHLVVALQSIASRTIDPLKSVVVSTTVFKGGEAFNVIPQRVMLVGTVRALEEGVRDLAEARLKAIALGTARMFGAEAVVEYERGYPVTVNHADQASYAVEAARAVAGPDAVNAEAPPSMGGEDFSFMLQARPGAIVFVGNGPSAGLHHPSFDFNDDIIPTGIQFWTNLAHARTRAP